MDMGWARFSRAPAPPGTALATLACPAAFPAGDPLVLLAAAVCLVLARYGEQRPSIAISRGTAGRLVLVIPADESVTAADHLAEVARLIGDAQDTRSPGNRGPDGPGQGGYVQVESAARPSDDDGEVALTLSLDTGADRRLASRYRTDLLDELAVRWMLHCLRNVIAGFARHADRPIGEIGLITDGHPGPVLPGEREPTRLDSGRTLHGMVAAQVAERADAVAVVSGQYRLTYRELDQAANRLAAELRRHRVGRADRVGVLMDRSHLLVVALLGVLKSGAAYVPLLPEYPLGRLEFLARDAAVAAVVTDTGWPAGADGPGGPVIRLSDRLIRGDLPESDPAPVPGGPDDQAYLLYTSGSTGEPKGVAVTHRNVASLLDATRRLGFGTGPDDIWTFFASYAWDFSVFEVFGCLASGGRLVVVPADVTRDPEEMHGLLREHRVTVLCQTPSVFANLLAADAEEPDDLAVRLLVLGGEQLDMPMMPRWFARYPEKRCRVMNMYGPTETTVFSTCMPVREESASGDSLSIGSAIPGWTIDVVDERDRRLPPGVEGEIIIGGPGVTGGYHNRRELTAQRFFTLGGGTRPVSRWYRAGDRARVLPDGGVEFLGRSDGQVKIRGYRVELGEIKAALLTDPSVRAAAVVPGRRGHGNRVGSLDAYVVGTTVGLDALRERLRATLPPHMMPGTITVLSALPVTRNGKLDVSRLPVPRALRAAAAPAGDDDPPSALRQMAFLWEQVLGVPVGLDEDLFLAGGNSLRAFEIVVKIRAAGLGPVSVRDLYSNSTVRALTAKLAAARADRKLTGGRHGG
jgi:amino acid adenylation domain-containing protein